MELHTKVITSRHAHSWHSAHVQALHAASLSSYPQRCLDQNYCSLLYYYTYAKLKVC